MFWQVDCNDGGEHDFGPSDVEHEAKCIHCWLTVGEIEKRKLCNKVIRLVGKDPYSEYNRGRIIRKMKEALKKINQLDKLDQLVDN